VALRITVIGAGICGATLADALARRGAQVTVIDQALPAGQATGGSFAWINSNNKPPRHYHDLSVRAMAEWRQLAASFGAPDWYTATGALTWAVTDRGRAALAEKVARLRDWEYPVEELTASAAAALEPALRLPADASFVFFPAEAYTHGPAVVDALLTRAQAHGAQVLTHEPVTGLTTVGGRVSGVRLASGRTVPGDLHVCCAGWRTPDLVEELAGGQVSLVPVDTVGSKAPCLIADLGLGQPAPIRRVILAPDITARPGGDGGVRVEAPDLTDRIHRHTPDAERAAMSADLVARTQRLLPDWEPRGSRQFQVCVRPLPVDGHPIVGWLASGLYVVVTHSGITLAPLLARLVCRELLDDHLDPVLTPYRPDRF